MDRVYYPDTRKRFAPSHIHRRGQVFELLRPVQCHVNCVRPGRERPSRVFAFPDVSNGNVRIENGILFLPDRYQWNGASGPTLDSGGIRAAALVHDALYELLKSGKLPMEFRADADLLFRWMLRLNGVNAFRRWYYYLGVRWFGRRAARP